MPGVIYLLRLCNVQICDTRPACDQFSRGGRFYCDRLGFRQAFAYRPFGGADPCYMGLTRDDVEVHVSSFSGDGVAGGVVFVGVEDVDALHKELKATGVVIDLEPTDQSWGNREMYVHDPDGNSIRFVHRGG